MTRNRTWQRLKITAFALASALLTTALLPASQFAAGATLVKLTVPSQPISAGQSFVITIDVQPGDNLTGVQANLSFDPALVQVTGVTEGNLIKQSGITSYFAPGTIDNPGGSVSGICSVILGSKKSVSAAGTLAAVSFKSTQASGTCPFNLSNVLASDLNASAIPVTITNSQLVLGSPQVTTVPQPPVPSAPSSPSSPPAGAGGQDVPAGAAPAANALKLDASGLVAADFFLSSADQLSKVTIPQKTQARTSSGGVLSQITLEKGPSDASGKVLGPVYDLGPEGATFDPPVSLSLGYDPASLKGLSDKDLAVGWWNPLSQVWEVVPESSVDTGSHIVTAPLAHFSRYAVIQNPPKPASIRVSNLHLESSELTAGQALDLAVTASNGGGLPGSGALQVSIDGEPADFREFALDAGESEVFNFNLPSGVPGTHQLQVNDLAQVYTVSALSSAPAPQPVPPAPAAVVDLPLSSPIAPDIDSAPQASPLVTSAVAAPEDALPFSQPTAFAAVAGAGLHIPWWVVSAACFCFSLLFTFTLALRRAKQNVHESYLPRYFGRS